MVGNDKAEEQQTFGSFRKKKKFAVNIPLRLSTVEFLRENYQKFLNVRSFTPSARL